MQELTLSGSLRFRKGGVDVGMQYSGQKVDVSGSNYIHNVQSIGTTQEALLLGDVATPGYGMFRNLDSTNPVEIRPTTSGSDTIRLKAGEYAGPFRLEATAPYAIATAAAVRLEYLIIEA